MPNLNEFLNNNKVNYSDNSIILEELSGLRPCSQCDENVDGALWDPVELTMYWTCSKNHKNSYKVN